MCALGRHQLEDDLAAPRSRARSDRSRQSRKQQRAARDLIHGALADEIHKLPDGQAQAQEQFALEFEPLPPGADIPDAPPKEVKLPYWVDSP